VAVVGSVLDLIGDTPLVDVSGLAPTPGARLLVKLEGQNPGGSIKDRVALAMVEAAEADGSLRPGGTILEPSSGNTGIGLAMVCRLKGYRLRVVMPENVSVERRQLLEIFGAEIIPSSGAEGSNGAVRRAQQLAKELDDVVLLFQYGNPANPAAHYRGTGPEIWRDCPAVTHVVAGLGTTGTLMGVGRYLREQRPDVAVWAVEPPAGESVEGLRNLDEGFVPPIYDPDLLDRRLIVRPRESIEWTRRLTAEAGIFAGISSGAVLAGAARAAAEAGAGAVVVAILADAGWKYLSTGAWTDDIDAVVERARRIIYF
jgi:cysteine synthase B